MTILWILGGIAVLLFAWLVLARQRIAQEHKQAQERLAALQSQRSAAIAKIKATLPKQSSKLPDQATAQQLQDFFGSLTKPNAAKVQLLREELVAIDDKLAHVH